MTQEKKERQSNFELLRILLMLTIPVYHLMLYNGVFYMDYHKNVAPGLFLSQWGSDHGGLCLYRSDILFSAGKQRPPSNPAVFDVWRTGADPLCHPFYCHSRALGIPFRKLVCRRLYFGWSMVVRSTLYGPCSWSIRG